MLEELLLVNPNNISLADGSHSWDQQLGAEGTASLAGRGFLGGTAAAWRLGASGVGPSKGMCCFRLAASCSDLLG